MKRLKTEIVVTWTRGVMATIGFFAIVLISLLSMNTLSAALTTCVIAISVAHPAMAVTLDAENTADEPEKFPVTMIARMIAVPSGLTAMFCIFWHFSGIAAFLFAVGVMVWYMLMKKSGMYDHDKPADSPASEGKH